MHPHFARPVEMVQLPTGIYHLHSKIIDDHTALDADCPAIIDDHTALDADCPATIDDHTALDADCPATIPPDTAGFLRR